MIRKTPSFKAPRKERVVRPSLSYRPKAPKADGYTEEPAKPRKPRFGNPTDKYAKTNRNPNFDERRPVMKETQKTRYKIPKAPKISGDVLALSAKGSTHITIKWYIRIFFVC